jgi:uncharacterized protein YutD
LNQEVDLLQKAKKDLEQSEVALKTQVEEHLKSIADGEVKLESQVKATSEIQTQYDGIVTEFQFDTFRISGNFQTSVGNVDRRN